MGSRFWSRQVVEQLIAEIRERVHLYDPKHPQYNDRIKRMDSLAKICAAINGTEEKFTIDCVRRKFHTLRTQYHKEKKLVNASIEDGGDIYEPTLWCYEQLDFLADIMKIGTKNWNNQTYSDYNPLSMPRSYSQQGAPIQFVEETVDHGAMNCYLDKVNRARSSSNESFHSEPKMKRSKNETMDVLEVDDDSCDNVSEAPRSAKDAYNNKDAFELFGEHVANEMRLLSDVDEVQFQLKTSIMKAILDANSAAFERRKRRKLSQRLSKAK